VPNKDTTKAASIPGAADTQDGGVVYMLAISRQESDSLFLGAMNVLDIRCQEGSGRQCGTVVSLEPILIPEEVLI